MEPDSKQELSREGSDGWDKWSGWWLDGGWWVEAERCVCAGGVSGAA